MPTSHSTRKTQPRAAPKVQGPLLSTDSDVGSVPMRRQFRFTLRASDHSGAIHGHSLSSTGSRRHSCHTSAGRRMPGSERRCISRSRPRMTQSSLDLPLRISRPALQRWTKPLSTRTSSIVNQLVGCLPDQRLFCIGCCLTTRPRPSGK